MPTASPTHYTFYDKTHNKLIFNKAQIAELKEYGYILIQLLNDKWVQLLEKFNRAPKIASKVKGSQENKIRQTSLTKYKELLLEEFDKGGILDFYTGEQLALHDISIDHYCLGRLCIVMIFGTSSLLLKAITVRKAIKHPLTSKLINSKKEIRSCCPF